jgi:tetratricopeptide (TPR) repeat protein
MSLNYAKKYSTMNFNRFASLCAVTCVSALFCTAALPQQHSTQPSEYQEAGALLLKGQLDDALAKLDTFLTDRPKDAHGRFLKGVIYTRQKKIDAAIGVFTELTQDYPELPEPYNNLAVLHAERGHYEQARLALVSAVQALPTFPAAHENLGDVYAKLAAQSYEKAIKLDKVGTSAPLKLKLINDMLSGALQR